MKAQKIIYRVLSLLVVAVLVFSLAPPRFQAAAATPLAASSGTAAQSLPAPLAGSAPTATLNLSQASGYNTEVINVSGQVSAPASSVRLAWIYGDGAQTVTAAVAKTSGTGYSTQISVPADSRTGPAQVCATVTGDPGAKFTCADFTITEPPAGSVSGSLPVSELQAQGAQAVNATFHLFNQSGESVASAPVAQDGAFQLGSVPAGTYTAGVEGQVSQPVDFERITILPGQRAVTSKLYKAPETTYLNGFPCYETAAKVTAVAGSPSNLNDYGIVEPDRSALTYAYNALGPKSKPKPSAGYDFGLYITGVNLDVSFSAYVQRTGSTQVQRVEYYAKVGKAEPVLLGASSTKPYAISTNIGQFPAGQVTLYAVPVVNNQPLCVTKRTIQMIADPMKSDKYQPGSSTVWSAADKVYYFEGTIPNVLGLLPVNFDTPSLPLFGVFENRFNAGVIVSGYLSLDGRVAVMTMDAQLYARLMNNDIVNQWQDLAPGGKLLGQWLAPDQVSQVAGMIPPYNLAHFRKDLTLFSGPIIAVPPWVVVRASISVGVAGDLTFSGAVYPFQPAVELSLTPSIHAWLGFSLAVDVIFGIAGAEAKIEPGIGVALPLRINPDDERQVWFDDPCLSLNVRLVIEGRFLFFTFNILDQVVVNEHIPSGCNAGQMLAQAQSAADALAAPAVLESPTVAVDPVGRMLMAYIEDPGGTTPAPRVMVRFKAAGSTAWGSPQALTDGTHSVSDPVAAFAGAGDTPIVAWTQNSLSLGGGNDLADILGHQEIYAATWNGPAGNVPVRLTNDLVGDGRAAIAGDRQGATLAWTRDTDGDLTTRSDQLIAVREWTPVPGNTNGNWSAMDLLQASASGGMNAQVGAARLYFSDPATGQETSRRILAWTFDADGDINTNTDRRLAVAVPAAGGWAAALTSEVTARADSPAVSISLSDPDHAILAFLVRGKDGDGLTDTGVVSNQAKLWTAQYQFGDGSVTNVMPVLDAEAAPVRAEMPRLASTPGGETLLVFRQFGEAGTALSLGQIAVARRTGSGDFSRALVLTGGARQNWQAAAALDPSSGQAAIIKIGRPPILPVGSDAALLLAELDAQRQEPFEWSGIDALSGAGATLDFVAIQAAADPALGPALGLSQAHAAPGETVTLTATVQNLGFNPSGAFSVDFYRGQPGSGVLIESVPVASLGFNEQQVVSILLTAGEGEQPVYAQVNTPGENTSTQNDEGTADLGGLAAPKALGVQESTLYEDALAIKWQPVTQPGIAGYRVLRSAQAGGPYELVGEATQAVFNDTLLAHGQDYCYIIQAFDDQGVVSPLSNEVCGGLPLRRLYLPTLRR